MLRIALLVFAALTFVAPAHATEHDHEHADEALDDATLREAQRAYHAARAKRAVQFRANRAGALAGKRIGVSAGHGIIWTPSVGSWLFQRATEAYSWGGLREDIHTAQTVSDYLAPMIERAGGEVIAMRERSYIETSTVVDNDTAANAYVETGTWETGGSEGYESTYRFAYLTPQGASTATWSFSVPEDAVYPVYAYFLASDNRSNAAQYTIVHATGTEDVEVDQSRLRPEDWPVPDYPNTPPGSGATRRHNDLWHHLGNFPFRAGETYEVTLTARGTDAEQVVIADAIHVGGGMNAAPAPNGSFSGHARWREGAMAYLRWLGAPNWVFVGDVTVRPLYSVYQGVDAYLAVHTNCCNSQGTSTWVWYPEMYVGRSSWPSGYAAANLPPGTVELADNVHRTVMQRARANWKSDWRDGGIVGANFGELRPFQKGWYEDRYTYGVSNPMSIPAMLIEFAFHDTEHDSRYIREEGFRHDIARGMFAGLLRSMSGADAVIPPLPPAALHSRVVDNALEVSWTANNDPLEPTATPKSYRVYTSSDGLLWNPDAVEVTTTTTSLPLDGCEPLFVRVTAVNEGGESLDSPVVGGRQGFEGAARVLYVDGVDRELRTEEDPSNDRAWARVYVPAILAALPGATVEMSTDDGLSLVAADYDLVVWATGQTSTAHKSLNANDRAAINDFLNAGTKLLLSGSELVWEHVTGGDATAAAFVRDTLHVDYVADDANTMKVDATALGLGSNDFGNCSADAPCVHYPDVIAPLQGGTVLASYPTGGAAIVESAHGVIMAGFPLETLAPPAARETFIAALVARSLDGVSQGSDECPAPAVPDDTGNNNNNNNGDTGPTGPDGGVTGPDAGATPGGSDADVPSTTTIEGGGSGCCSSTNGGSDDAPILLLLGFAWLLRRRRSSGAS